jgi:predicted membrane protein
MPLINIVIALIVVGVGLWLINRFVPMASSIKTILNVVVVIAVIVWVLQGVGLWGQIRSYKFSH